MPRLEETTKRLRNARKTVEKLDAFRFTKSEEIPAELMEKLVSITTDTFYQKYEKTMSQLESLKHRFSRDEINISFVGRAGQGKSLVLQRISGLEGDVIPSADGMDCTGARSVISNRPGVETKAEIIFYSEREFVDIVNLYLRKIFNSEIYCISSLSEIKRLDIEELRHKVSYDQVEENSLFTHLEKYITHAQELQAKLGTRETISKGEIESYVAQYSSKNPEQKFYTYLGVKGANIISTFPCTQCGKIVLVDTIGTGATSLGVDEEMLRTVKEDSDAIILMMRPAPLRPRLSSEDYKLVESISAAVSPEYAKQMLFWLINRVETPNGSNVRSIPEIMGQLRKQDLPVAQYLDVNCWKQEEVEEKFLLPVLKQMSSNLSSIDRMILERMNEELVALEQAFHAISSRIERALGASVNPDERREFHGRIKKTISRMTNAIRDLYLQKDKEKEHPCEVLREAAAVKLKDILIHIPSREDIMQRLNDGTINQHNALEQLANQLRLQIINDFLELNGALHQIVQDMKGEVIHILANEEIGRLGCILGVSTAEPDVWIQSFQGKLDETRFPLLQKALMPLEEFDLRMENFLIYKVRCCLQPIDWSANTQPPQLYNGLDDKEALAEEIESQLRYFLEIVHQKIEDELSDFYVFPNTALYAVLRDFYDRAVCASKGDDISVETEWQYLYEDMIPRIWAKEHKEYVDIAGCAEEWRLLTENINVCAVDRYFLIKIQKENV